MDHQEISLFFAEARLFALQKYLAEEGATVSDKLAERFTELYEQYVPEEERFMIETDIERQDAEDRAETEARKRFGVFHIRDGGEDSYFKSELFHSFLAVAHRYRLYDRGELSSQPKTFHDAFGETIPIPEEVYNDFREDIKTDSRVLGVYEFNLDDGTASVCQNQDNEWSAYNLSHVSTAAFRAYRSTYIPYEEREAIMNEYLNGKEIEIPDDSEAPAMQM